MSTMETRATTDYRISAPNGVTSITFKGSKVICSAPVYVVEHKVHRAD